jgi:hypothetical protein
MWGSGGIIPRILDVSTRVRSVIGFMPLAIFSWEQSPLPLERVVKYLMKVFTFKLYTEAGQSSYIGDG